MTARQWGEHRNQPVIWAHHFLPNKSEAAHTGGPTAAVKMATQLANQADWLAPPITLDIWEAN